MANLFDLLIKKNNIDYTKNMPPLKPVAEMTPVQIGQNGEMIQNPQIQPEQALTLGDRFKNKTNLFGQKLSNALLGTASQPTDNIDTTNGTLNVTVSENPRSGGILRDIAGGYKENRFTPASLENFGQNKDKGFAYRLGEGLGSLARFGESPLGRSLLVGGAIGALGGSPAEALTFGAVTGATNQMNRTNDRIYRDDLIASQQQALRNNPEFAKLDADKQKEQLNAIANNINGLRGYMNQNTYGNLIRSQQLRDNADWRKMYFDAQQKNLEAQREWQRQQAEMQRNENAANRAVQMRGQDLNYKLGQDRLEASTGNKIDKTSQKAISENMQTLADIQAGLQLIEENPNAYSWIKGKLGADITNRIDPAGIKARTAIDNITAVYRKWLTGAQMSDAERKAYERFLPAPTDNYKAVKAKLEGMRDSIQRKNDVLMNSYNTGLNTNTDPLGIL